ncbi:ABC transporter substrate-binding protein [Gordonia zhaorongruii]|uniref:ABC transporter substrate-binding protein n=1 Tax=Gordonia zhaorongruii TaxID=2597659 RepID=UPI00104C9425|nr:ABC transporter substrate-binding protein [Gordonia zhaorongruii]
MRDFLRTARRGRLTTAVAAAACSCALTVGLVGCGSSDDVLRTPDGSVISTTTTRFAQVNIVNPGRDYSRTCLAPTPADPGTADVQRIVVTDPALLDSLCALGLGPQVRAVVAAPGSVPAYLGPQLASVPALGDQPAAPDVRAADPDVILSTPETASRMEAIASTGAAPDARTVTIAPSPDWQDEFSETARAVNRAAAGKQRLDEFAAEAARVGRLMDAAHTQASLVRFQPDQTTIEGTDSFAAQIMKIVGVDRPAAQRTPDAVKMTDDNHTEADADLIYVSYQGEEGKARGKDVLLSDQWLDMGAPTWKRVLSVDDGVWYADPGLSAAWLIVNDLKSSLNGSSAAE